MHIARVRRPHVASPSMGHRLAPEWNPVQEQATTCDASSQRHRRAQASLVELTRNWKPDGQTQKGGEPITRGAAHASQGRSSADWGDHGSTGVSLWEGAKMTMGSWMIVSSHSDTRLRAASSTANRSASAAVPGRHVASSMRRARQSDRQDSHLRWSGRRPPCLASWVR